MSPVVSLPTNLSSTDGGSGRDRTFSEARGRSEGGEGKKYNVLMTVPVTLKEGLEWKPRKGLLLNSLDFPSQ